MNCAVSWFRLLLIRAETEEWTDEFGSYLNAKDTDVQRTEEYLQVASSISSSDSTTLCLYAQFLEKKRDFVGAEGNQSIKASNLNSYLLVNFLEYFLRSLEADSKNPLAAILYGNFLLARRRSEDIANTFLNSPSCEVLKQFCAN